MSELGRKNKVVHVFTKDMKSKIFKDIFEYFVRYGNFFKHVSDTRIENKEDDEASLESFYIYHRPQLVEELEHPCACVVHHDLNDPNDAFSPDKFLLKYEEADLIICINETQEKTLNDLGLMHTIVIHHGYNDKLIKPKVERKLKERFTLGYFSRRYGRLVKGESFLYEIAARLSPNEFDFLLIGQDRHIDAEFLESMGFQVTYASNVPYPVLCRSYLDIDALLVLSVSEGGPACVPEALGCGVPLIARAVGMVPEMFEIGKCGVMLIDDPELDVRSIRNLSEKYEDILKNMKQKIYVKPWSATVGSYETAINETLARYTLENSNE